MYVHFVRESIFRPLVADVQRDDLKRDGCCLCFLMLASHVRVQRDVTNVVVDNINLFVNQEYLIHAQNL